MSKYTIAIENIILTRNIVVVGIGIVIGQDTERETNWAEFIIDITYKKTLGKPSRQSVKEKISPMRSRGINVLKWGKGKKGLTLER